MARTESSQSATPRATLKKSTSSSQKQQSIAGFFKKQAGPAPQSSTPAKRASDTNVPKVEHTSSSPAAPGSSPRTAPGASQQSSVIDPRNKENGVYFRSRNFNIFSRTDRLIETPGTVFSSPSRQAKKKVNYAESDDDDDAPFKPVSGNGRAAKRRRVSVKDDSDDDEFGLDAATQAAMDSDEGMLVLILGVI